MVALPYVTAPGNIDKALGGIKTATVPQRVTQDFVKTILKIPGGSGDQMTTFLKKLGLSNSDGTPSETYQKFRNPTTSGAALAKAIRHAYAPLYVRNEYMHQANSEELIGLIMEETGQSHDARPVRLITSCIEHLKAHADFDASLEADATKVPAKQDAKKEEPIVPPNHPPTKNIGLNLGYTINLNLPATSDPAVFDAIFKSLKENLMSDEDA